MTSSIVQICNRALSEMGTQSFITSLDEVSVEAQQCALWYDNIRQSMLRAAPWGFARKQVILTELGNAQNLTAPYPYLFKYAYPADAIKIRYLLASPTVAPDTVAPNVSDGPGWPYPCQPSRQNRYLVASDVDAEDNTIKVILTNLPFAIAVYTTDISNPDLFDTMFDSALTAALAYKLVIPLSGNVGMRDQFRQSGEGSIMNARAADGNEAIPKSDWTPDWIAGRGVGQYGYGNASPGPLWGQWTDGYDDYNWGM